jgi:hypothetical protein
MVDYVSVFLRGMLAAAFKHLRLEPGFEPCKIVWDEVV